MNSDDLSCRIEKTGLGRAATDGNSLCEILRFFRTWNRTGDMSDVRVLCDVKLTQVISLSCVPLEEPNLARATDIFSKR